MLRNLGSKGMFPTNLFLQATMPHLYAMTSAMPAETASKSALPTPFT